MYVSALHDSQNNTYFL